MTNHIIDIERTEIMTALKYDEVIEVQGVRIPFVPSIITPQIERQMRMGKYEGGECSAARKWVFPGDRVLELGSGVGLVSSAISKIGGVEKVVSIEANAGLIDLIEETHRINDITNVEIRNGIAADKTSEDVPFYVRGNFWASSMEPDSRPYREKVMLPAYGIGDLIEELRPTVIVADIEGGELDVFENVDLKGVRTIIIEVHPLVYGVEGQRSLLKNLDEQGFRAEQEYVTGSVWVLTRHPKSEAPRIHTRGASEPKHASDAPHIVIPTCMKDEGPFLLEWIAYHRSIGVNDFVVFTNDCSDGTDLMLDRLDELGVVTHLPNPAVAAGSTFFQPLAMKFAVDMPQVRRADYVIQTDVDEFINIKVGEGHLTDLFEAAGPFHVLSISELNFSSNAQWEITDTWVTEAFREHETHHPGHWQARRGVKSIIHGLDNFESWPVHRPGVVPGTHDQLIWLDGSGEPVPEEFLLKHENGIDRRGRYDLVQLDHHPLRSAESFLLKQDRGDVVNKDRTADLHYYRKRALGGHFDGAIDNKLSAARETWEILVSDEKLSRLHKDAVDYHQERAKQIQHQASFTEMRQWLKDNYFPD
ncbi:FkbM family methyltransferase [Aliiroseovarius sp. 2305UL8-7]|uniref:FkbM family methyltransferase n=1 Tax=Aliiroseovarius conchicola TaxID=3121637 RepID=UPI003529C2A4